MLLLPAAVLAWYVALLAGLALHGFLDRLCPADQLVSGYCIAPWFRVAEQAAVCFGAGLAAVLILVACTVLAPAHRRQVSIAVYVLGAVVACRMGFAVQQFAALAAALIAGAAMLALLLRRFGREISQR
jgi:hypothetical protein